MSTTQIHITPETLHRRLADLLAPEAAAWAEEARASVAKSPGSLPVLSAGAGLRCGRAPLGPGFADWTADDAVRVLLLCSVGLEGGPLAEAVEELYRQGDTAERRAVLRALPLLGLGERAVPLVRDALRANDPRLIAAALGPGSADHLDQRSWRDGVLKCLFTGVPLAAVADLPGRADPELLRMFADYAAERVAAGRPVPDDLRAHLDPRED